MSISQPTQRVFTPFEVIYWGLFCGIPTCLAIGAHLTKQDPPVALPGWIILWAVVLGFWVIAGLFMQRRWQWIRWLRFVVTPPGLIVAWAEDSYCVNADAVEAEVTALLAIMTPTYPSAAAALRDCVVQFREPTWIQDVPPRFIARKVAGVQDEQLIFVGWREDLRTSTLRHELAHRVLELCAGNPDETTAHALMAKLGIS